MTRLKKIIVAANGPSAYCPCFRDHVDWTIFEPTSRIFRTNYFYLNDGDPLTYVVDDWFICEDVSDCRAVRAAARFGRPGFTPTIWLPGISEPAVRDIERNHLAGFDIRIQKTFAQLPAACRWERDLAPERPLMGSYALAVAVGMNPEKIILAGHDLFSHTSGETHAGTEKDTRDWQKSFNAEYLQNRHRNHRLRGDLRYIRSALRDYSGKVISFGTVLKKYFADEFPAWDWHEG